MRNAAILLTALFGVIPISCKTAGGGEQGPVVQATLCPACGMFCGPECPLDDPGIHCKACGKKPLSVEARSVSWYWCGEHNVWHERPCGLNTSKNCCSECKAMAIVLTDRMETPYRRTVYCPDCRCFCGKECPLDDKGCCKKCGKKPVADPHCVMLTYFWCDSHKVWHDVPCGQHASKKCCTEQTVTVLVTKK